MLLSGLLTACYLRRCTTLVADVVTTMKEGSRTMWTRHLPEGTKRTVLWWRAAGPLAVVLVAVAVSLAACGGSPSKGVAGVGSTTTTSPSSAAQTPLASAVRFANCMRSHGVTNYPDPSSNGRAQSLNQINPSSPTFQRAYTACQKYLPNGEVGPPAPTAAQLRFALAFAHCLRKHGFPQFPDPLTTYGPGFTLGRGSIFPISARPSSSRRRSPRRLRPAECSFPPARPSLLARQMSRGRFPDFNPRRTAPPAVASRPNNRRRATCVSHRLAALRRRLRLSRATAIAVLPSASRTIGRSVTHFGGRERLRTGSYGRFPRKLSPRT